MSQLRKSIGFYIKAYDIPCNTVKTAYFNRLKYFLKDNFINPNN